jgi:phenylacetate-coenzyme A ligase PaaK-like adenylate-forming protein
MILEPVDEEYRPVPPGHRSSTVLLTNLANEVQPIIRYDLGDGVLVSPKPCPCGSPLPAIRVDGRSDDILTFTAPDGRAISLVPLALATPVYEAHGVRRYQVIQTAPDRLSVRLDIAALHEADRVWADVHRRLRAYLAEHGLQSVSVERAAEAPALDPGTGKLRHVVCQVAPGNSGTLAR